MNDRVQLQGNEVAFDDDFEWVNAWAAADKPQEKPRDPQPSALPDALRVEARSAVEREESVPVIVARNFERAEPKDNDDVVDAPRASAAAAELLLDAVSVV